MSKHDRFISAYFLDIKKIVDTLAVTGSPISNEKYLEAILDCLSEYYKSFIMFVTTRLDPYTMEDIEALLLALEDCIEKYRSHELHLVQANLASTQFTYISSSRPIPGANSSQNHVFHPSPRNNNPTRHYYSSQSIFKSPWKQFVYTSSLIVYPFSVSNLSQVWS